MCVFVSFQHEGHILEFHYSDDSDHSDCYSKALKKSTYMIKGFNVKVARLGQLPDACYPVTVEAETDDDSFKDHSGQERRRRKASYESDSDSSVHLSSGDNKVHSQKKFFQINLKLELPTK